MSMPSQILAVLRANASLTIGLLLCIGPAVALLSIGALLRSAGASLKPLLLIAALIAPIAISFFAAGLVRARDPFADAGAVEPGLAVRDGRFADRAKLFGADVDAAFIRDARGGLPGILDEAQVAEAAVPLDGETILVAQFPGEDHARRAAKAYRRAFQLRDVGGDELDGWRAKRGAQGDFIEMLLRGRLLFVWTGLTKSACAARRAAADLENHFPALALPTAESGPPLFPALQPVAAFLAPTGVKAAGILLLLLIYVGVFFKGATWAGSVAPAPVTSVAARELASRLLSVNDLDAPFEVTRGDKPGEFIAGWRYADAKWMDHARAHGLRRAFRIRMTLDETARTVRATDYVSDFDWSAGADGARMEWKAGSGVMFFQKERQSVFGLQIGGDGRLKPQLSYRYRFDASEMKSPLMACVTQAGWTWRSSVWQGPAWLRWLTD